MWEVEGEKAQRLQRRVGLMVAGRKTPERPARKTRPVGPAGTAAAGAGGEGPVSAWNDSLSQQQNESMESDCGRSGTATRDEETPLAGGTDTVAMKDLDLDTADDDVSRLGAAAAAAREPGCKSGFAGTDGLQDDAVDRARIRRSLGRLWPLG